MTYSLISRLMFFGVACLGLAVFATNGHAKLAQKIGWRNLQPATPALADPRTALTQDQQLDIETIIWVRSLSTEERELDYNKPGVEDAAKYEKQFKDAGIDVDAMLQKINIWQQKMQKRQQQVNDTLDGKRIKLAGYLLPIEFSEKGQKDFLLVPNVGACVHVPPPPPNQIVYVRLSNKMVVKDLYTPVWIEGLLKTKSSSKKLKLIDGERKVSIGYHIDGATSEPYTR